MNTRDRENDLDYRDALKTLTYKNVNSRYAGPWPAHVAPLPLIHVTHVGQIFHPNGNVACHFHATSNCSVCLICHSAPAAAQIGLPLSLSSE